MRKIDLVYYGADSITLNWFNEVLYKLLYYRMYEKGNAQKVTSNTGNSQQV